MITVTGADDLIRDLMDVQLDALRPVISQALEDIGDDAATYPAPPSGSRYQRTGDLGRGWTDGTPLIDLNGASLLGILANDVPYAAYVQDADEQVAIHTGRWHTTEAITAAWEDRVAARIETALDALLAL